MLVLGIKRNFYADCIQVGISESIQGIVSSFGSFQIYDNTTESGTALKVFRLYVKFLGIALFSAYL